MNPEERAALVVDLLDEAEAAGATITIENRFLTARGAGTLTDRVLAHELEVIPVVKLAAPTADTAVKP